VIQMSPLGETLGREAMHFNLETAGARFVACQTVSASNP